MSNGQVTLTKGHKEISSMYQSILIERYFLIDIENVIFLLYVDNYESHSSNHTDSIISFYNVLIAS